MIFLVWTPSVSGMTKRRYVRYDQRKIRPTRYAQSTRGVKVAHAVSGAARIGSRSLGPIGWAVLAYDVYNYVKSREISYQITESTPKSVYDLEPWLETPEYQYQDLTGYEDDGPVHWTRTV